MLQLDELMVPFNVYTRWKEADMGKSIKGKELGKGITQRKSDGLYQGRFVNRFGKTQTIYASLHRMMSNCLAWLVAYVESV